MSVDLPTLGIPTIITRTERLRTPFFNHLSSTSTLMPKLKALMDLGALINVNGCARANASANYATAVDIVKKEGHYIIEGFDSSSWRTPILDLTELTPAAVSDGVNQLL